MNTLVLFESQFGNTQKLAELIGKELEAHGPVRVASFTDYAPTLLTGIDLLVIGAPTQAHGMTAPMKQFVEKLESVPAGISVAVFDTRVKGPMILWGSAARAIVPKLGSAGFKVIAEPENFIVTFTRPPELDSGEEAHAKAWAARIAGLVPVAA
ncbi:MAG TPA: flavodoxin family protein [Candidatus Udaeobacter sp.]|nr:flavodoxin family protein [Candidatus Udaeobacter sp.]